MKDSLVLVLGVVSPSTRGFYSPEGYFHVNVHVGRLVDERPEDAHHRECKFISPEYGNGFYLRGLAYTSQGDRQSARLYATGVRYEDVRAVELHEAKWMVKTLTTIEGRMRRMTDKFGHPPDFVEEVMRFGTAVGAKAVFFRPEDAGRASGSTWDERPFGPEARYAIGWVVRHATTRFGAKEEAHEQRE